jgi:hypothetical protein
MSESPDLLPEIDAKPATSNKSAVAPEVLVYGGTPSSYQDAIDQRKRFETEQRRTTADSMFQSTRESPDQAHMYSRKLQGNAYVILEYRDKEGHVLDYLECDVSMLPGDGTLSLALCIPCPVCVLRRGKPVGDSIMLLQQRNRAFVLDTKNQGELWVNPHDPAQSRIRAGSVTSEPFRCQNGCHTKWVIDKDWLREI